MTFLLVFDHKPSKKVQTEKCEYREVRRSEMRLIDADALIEHMRKAYNKRISDWDLISTVAVIGAEEDAKPIRHGHWIITNKPNIYGGTIIKCSECGYEGVIAHIEDHHYCWVCGAKMEEVEE